MTAPTPHRGNKKSQRHSTERRAADPPPFPRETDAILPGQVDNPDGEVENVSPRKSSRRLVPTLPSGLSSLPSAHHNPSVSTQGKGKAPAKHDVEDGNGGSSNGKIGTSGRGNTAEHDKAYVRAALAAKARHVQEKKAKASGKKPCDSPELLLRPVTSRLKVVRRPDAGTSTSTNPLQALINHSRIQGLEGNPLYSSASRIEYPDGRVKYRVEFNVHRVQCTSCQAWFANGNAYDAHHRDGGCAGFEGSSDKGTDSDNDTHDDAESDAEDEHDNAADADAEEGARSSHHRLPTRPHITSRSEEVQPPTTELITPHPDRHGRFYADKSSVHAPLRPCNVGGRAANYIPARQSGLRNSVSPSDLAPEFCTARMQPADEIGRSLGTDPRDDDDDEEDGYPSDHSMDDDIIRPPRHRRPRRVDTTPRHPPSDDEDACALYGGRAGATAGGDLGWIL